MGTQEDRALTVVNRPQLTLSIWEMIERIAPAMYLARLFGVSSKEQAMAVMLKGFEMGMGLAASFEYIHIVEGKPSLSPRGALAMIHSSPLNAGIKIENLTDGNGKPSGCRVWMKRADTGFEHTITWTIEDAERANLITKAGTTRADGTVRGIGNWEKWPANLCRWRAVGFCADVVFPEVGGGMKRADEYGADLTPDGDVIEGSWRVAPELQLPPTSGAPVVAETPVAPPQVKGPTLDDLMQQYSAEAIIVANEGKIPGTDAELAAVAEKLAVQNG